MSSAIPPVKRDTAPSSSRRPLQAAFESLPAPTWVADLDGRYLHVSQAYAGLLGRQATDCPGLTLEEVLPLALGRLTMQRHRQLLESRGRKRFEQIWTVKGEPRWFEVHMSCLCDDAGAPMAVCGHIQDMTQHVERQETARRTQNELELRVAQRTRQLSATNEELEAFSYSVSHDLRAPVRQIGGFAELLQRQLGGQLASGHAEYLRHILDSTHRMDRLIGDLLQLARINRGDLRKVPVDLAALAREVLAGLAGHEPQRRVETALPGSAIADCDAGLMRIALDNLLGNAWKFTGRQERAHIEFGSLARDTATIYFVRDNGAGFALETAGRLFGAFQRFHRESDFPGTGVGLATVRRIISRHGGRIWAESAPGRGATFYFTLEASN
ncbi:Phytochrome-like protein cph1 [Pigmentiphaga humi]|uniref:histidine kinase n=1 Tax=Pigmentiphaga humi TaxID=2478468 RepID=A0A3P4B1I5_9BURK|nr:ATP-binding protein [Pigmentiphaga humi]VCU69922.1 Phytochrome-like protein cph1 [Pigmentiphaga humi]